MKILYFTPWLPDLNTGGGRHCYMNLLALTSIPGAAIDYVGPESGVLGEPDFGGRVTAALSRPVTRTDKLFGAANLATTPAYGLARELARRGALRYDLAFVETTRCGFVFDFLSGTTRTLCSSHNVEYDYLAVNRHGPRRMLSALGRRSERRSLALADHLLVMHQDHLARYRQLYGGDCCRAWTFHPVCSTAPRDACLPWPQRKRKAVITGSLNVAYNEASILSFMRDGWTRLSSLGFELVVAGRAPSQALAEEIRRHPNARLVPDPPGMQEILRDASLMIVPDLYGDGMKLRVAEGMSYGLPVAGTARALAGYDDAEGYAASARSMPELAAAVGSLMSDPSRLEKMSARSLEAWREKYSVEVFSRRIRRIVESLS